MVQEIIRRPKKISGDKASSESAWEHAIKTIEKNIKSILLWVYNQLRRLETILILIEL